MKRLVVCLLLAWVCLGAVAVRAERAAPRDLWPQAAAAAESGDITGAIKKTNDLTDAGRNLGIHTFPVYAEPAAGLAGQAGREQNKAKADWAVKAADQLDPISPFVAFNTAGRAADAHQFGQAVPAAVKGYARVFATYRSRLLSRCDTLIVLIAALAITVVTFAVALFIRYGRSMAHDFREMLGQQFRGGAVTVLAVAMLFLPVFLWLGPVWLLFSWFVIFFSYASFIERVLIIVIVALLAAAPILLDLASHWTAGVDSPVVVAAIASEEQAYYPGALHRMHELVGVAPENATLQLLLGNLELQEANEGQAGAAYRRSLELNETAGAHVNLGNLHFIENDFPAAVTEYGRAEQLDRRLAIAFYNHSVASGELYKFEDQAAQLDQARRLDRAGIEKLSSPNVPGLKIGIYRPPISTAWAVAATLARGGVARSLFGNYSWFHPLVSAKNPITLAPILTILAPPFLFFKRRADGLAGVPRSPRASWGRISSASLAPCWPSCYGRRCPCRCTDGGPLPNGFGRHAPRLQLGRHLPAHRPAAKDWCADLAQQGRHRNGDVPGWQSGRGRLAQPSPGEPPRQCADQVRGVDRRSAWPSTRDSEGDAPAPRLHPHALRHHLLRRPQARHPASDPADRLSPLPLEGWRLSLLAADHHRVRPPQPRTHHPPV